MDNFKPPQKRLDGLVPAVPPVDPSPSVTPLASESIKKRRLPKALKIALIIFPLLITLAGTKLLLATREVITRNNTAGAPALAGEIDPTKLKGEGDGRINILMLGIGGAGHEGPNLSDTIMVMSLDPRTKDVAMLSLPRDFYVPVPGYGNTKINAAHAYGESSRYEGGGPALAKLTISKILDLPIHYYARIDFNGFKKAVDSVGGIEVEVEKDLVDNQYPDERNPKISKSFSLKAGRHRMDGTLALKYVRCRKGTCGGDFGRAARQQQVLLALREKALSLKTLSNPAKLASLMDIIGSSARTDLQLSEIRKLAEIAQKVDPAKVVTKVLDTSPEGLLTFGNVPGAGSIEIPRAGINNFGEIQAFVHSIFGDSYIKEEKAGVEILNGSGRQGVADGVSNLLKAYNYSVLAVGTADRVKPATAIYDYTQGKKPYTLAYLEQRFKVKAQRLPKSTGKEADIVIVIGSNYKPPYTGRQ